MEDDTLKGNDLVAEAAEDIFALPLKDHGITSRESIILLPGVRLESLLFYLSSMMAFIIVFLVAAINSYC